MKELTEVIEQTFQKNVSRTYGIRYIIRRITKYSIRVYVLIYDVLFVVKKTYQFVRR